jgi:SAM-dependent methyltransferase
MDKPRDLPTEVDLSRPSAARVYDYFLGGAHNFEVDRQLAEQIAAMTPNLADTMRAGRAFLRRAVAALTEAGINQYLDIGSGIPTVGNVHEIAQKIDPQARVVYVDVDPVAVAHSRAILEGNERTAVIQADLRDPLHILAGARRTGLIDFDRPVGVLVAGVVHFVPDSDRPDEILKILRDAVPPGSYLVISHSTQEDQPAEMLEAQKLSAKTATEITLRSRLQVADFFGDFEILEPGIVHMPLWRPDSPDDVDEHPERFGAYGAVGRKPVMSGPGPDDAG